MTVQVRGAVSDGEAASATRYRVELEGAGGTMRIPCAPGVFPHHSTLVPFVSACRVNGIRADEVRLVDPTDGTVIARRRLETPLSHRVTTAAAGERQQQRRFPVHPVHHAEHRPDAQTLTVSDRAASHLAHLHRRAELPPGMAIAIHPGDGIHPRFAAKRPGPTDRVVATHADGSPLLVVPTQAGVALAGALLDFVATPEPGFVVLA